jgi:hypothetical protein
VVVRAGFRIIFRRELSRFQRQQPQPRDVSQHGCSHWAECATRPVDKRREDHPTLLVACTGKPNRRWWRRCRSLASSGQPVGCDPPVLRRYPETNRVTFRNNPGRADGSDRTWFGSDRWLGNPVERLSPTRSGESGLAKACVRHKVNVQRTDMSLWLWAAPFSPPAVPRPAPRCRRRLS